MTAGWAITMATVRQVLPLRRAIVFGLAEAAPAAVYLILVGALSEEAALDRLFGMIGRIYFPLLIPIVSLIVASSVLGAERRDGTLSFLVLRPIPRSVISGAKVVAAVIIAGGLNAFGALTLTLAYSLETGAWNLILPLIAGALIATVFYSAIFVPLGFFTDKAVLVGLLFVFVFENGIVFALTGLSVLSGWRLGFSTFIGLVPSDQIGPEARDFASDFLAMSEALLLSAVVVAISIAFVALLLRQRDLASE